jgi:hypothetical protein
LALTLAAHFSRSANTESKPLIAAKNGLVAAPFLGLSFTPPAGWLESEGTGGAYDPKQPIQSAEIPAARLPNGLVHGLSLYAWVGAKAGSKPSVEDFIAKFQHSDEMIEMKEIRLPIANAGIAKIYSFESRMPVGTGDQIAGFVVRSKLFSPERWKIAEHTLALAKEKPCGATPEGSAWGRTRGNTGLYQLSSTNPRVNAPVELVLIYSASKKSLGYAEKSLNVMLSTMSFDTHSGSEALASAGL